jgi:tripartite ATP-independent transporter DctP family solute receptor
MQNQENRSANGRALNTTGRTAMKRRDFMKLGAGFGAAGLGAAGLAASLPFEANAQTKAVFKASDVQPPGYPTVAATENLGKKLSEATQGRLSIQMYPSMQLGGEKETIEQTQIGAIQMLRASVGSMGPIVDDINVINMPFLFKNTAHANKMMDGPIGQELLDKITASPNANLVALCWMDSGARSLYNTKHPIKGIEDVKGLKFRVIGNPIFVDMMNALGGNGISMGYDQVFSALQTGVIDGAENNMPSYVFSNHYTAAKYVTLTEHLIIPEMLVFSKRIWNTLSGDDQTLIKKFAREAQLEEREYWNQYEQKALEKAKTAGSQIIEVSDKTPFQNAVKPVWDKYGPKYQDTIKRIQAIA